MPSAIIFAACVGQDPPIGLGSQNQDASPTTNDGNPNNNDGSDVGTDSGGPGQDAGCNADLQSDPNNCGACGNSCMSGAPCFEGVCDGQRVLKVASGNSFGCGLRASGSVWCWGGTAQGALGMLNVPGEVDCVVGTKCQPTPVRVPGVSNVAFITASYFAACAVTTAGDVYCWGRNSGGELGDHPLQNCGGTNCVSPPAKVAGLPGPVAKVSIGIATTCALLLDGSVWCWGQNLSGQRGNGFVDGGATVAPNKVIDLPPADEVAVSGGAPMHVCARAGKDIYCWGTAQHGPAGPVPGTTCADGQPCYSKPNKINLGVNVAPADLAMSISASCTRDPVNKTVQCWGYGGYGVGPDNATPTVMTSLANSIKISGHLDHVCGLKANGSVTCIGASADANLGVIADTSAPAPCFLPCRKGDQGAATVTGIFDFDTFAASTALRPDGQVVAWGSGSAGQLGMLPGTADGGLPFCGTSRCSPTPLVIPMPGL